MWVVTCSPSGLSQDPDLPEAGAGTKWDMYKYTLIFHQSYCNVFKASSINDKYFKNIHDYVPQLIPLPLNVFQTSLEQLSWSLKGSPPSKGDWRSSDPGITLGLTLDPALCPTQIDLCQFLCMWDSERNEPKCVILMEV